MPLHSSLGKILKHIFSLGNIDYPDEKKAGLSHLQVYFSRIKMFWECEIRIKYAFLFVCLFWYLGIGLLQAPSAIIPCFVISADHQGYWQDFIEPLYFSGRFTSHK